MHVVPSKARGDNIQAEAARTVVKAKWEERTDSESAGAPMPLIVDPQQVETERLL